MAISQTLSVDYSNRKIDLHIFQGVNAPNSSDITPSFGKISNFCTGIQKLAQRYTICLLTELGSQVSFSDFGSDLITSLTSSSNLYNRADLYPIFNEANAKIEAEFYDHDQKYPGAPDDERLASAALVDILSTPTGGVALSVELQTYSVEPVSFIIPLPI